ncbi:MAG: response regulator [SAR324 cluster bacterium]|nr:response regulator [SAR324 cluster bacterium]
MEKILIVDDDQQVRKMLFKHLSRSYKVFSADNGEEGLKVFQSEKPQLTILDLKMPIMDGIEFLKHAGLSSFEDRSVIVSTGFGDDRDIETCFQLGVQSFLRKPVNLIELDGLIRHAFDRIQSLSEIRKLNTRMSSLLKHVPDIIWECDPDLKITYVSENVNQMLGYSPEDLLGKPISSLLTEDDVGEFYFKIRKGVDEFHPEVRGLSLEFKDSHDEMIPLQISAKEIYDKEGNSVGIVGSARDMRPFSQFSKGIEKITGKMTIQVDEKMRLISADESAQSYFKEALEDGDEFPDFSSFLCDPSVSALFQFSFDQKEDLPFPVEIKLSDASGTDRHFNIQFHYQHEGECLEGHLDPVGMEEQLNLISEKVEKQDESLQAAILFDPEMQKSILKDSHNLTEELLDLIKALTIFAFESGHHFNLEEYRKFIQGKPVYSYIETLRLLGNKIHGLKGTSGFLISQSKALCHRMEDITRPLAENKLVLTESLSSLLKQFIFKVQEMLEKFEKNTNEAFNIDDWLEKIDQALEQATEYVGDQSEAFSQLISERGTDKGEVRNRRVEEHLSVSQIGYERLSELVQNLYQKLSAPLSQEELIESGTMYNEFLNTHQQIKKIPVNLSRYERLVPSIAEQYEKDAIFIYKDHLVLADQEFWNSMHEIFNHTLKNAVIHGLEKAEEREAAGKDRTGRITVEILEDALHIYVSVIDDGRGIDLEKIKQKAIENDVVSAEELQNLSQSEIFNLVFIQGVSTAESLDDNAGRGVGMNAVHEAMRRFNGSCLISSERGEGSKWTFSFPKRSVSLPCLIVKIGAFRIAVPEGQVEGFFEYDTKLIRQLDQRPFYVYQESAVALLNSQKIFDEEVIVDENRSKNVLLLNPQDKSKMGLVINEILYHATLPILELPVQYRGLPLYVGAVLYGSELVLVLNVNKMV